MRIITWNVNHRARAKKIPDQLSEAIGLLDPDIAVLTEYVSGDGHNQFIDHLGSTNLMHTRMRYYTPKEKQVLIASRYPLHEGDIEAPPIAPSVASNTLHISLPDAGYEILGLRVPDYCRELATKRKAMLGLDNVNSSSNANKVGNDFW